MAVRGPAQGQQRPVKDVDDDIIGKLKQRKSKDVNKAEAKEAKQEREDKALARKPGQIARGGNEEVDEEHFGEKDAEAKLQGDGRDIEKDKAEKKDRLLDAQKAKDKRDREGKGKGKQQQQQQQQQTFSVAELANDSRVNQARERGYQQTPDMAEIVAGKQMAATGPSFAEILPEARTKMGGLGVEEEIAPPQFLSPFEAMKDVYQKTKGRASPRTKDLLEGPDLEDLVQCLGELHEDEQMARIAEARVKGSIYVHLKDDPGPLLIGLNDERLKEPWRLFLDGWDIWVPNADTEQEAEEGVLTGVELFWEGEAEDEDGEEFEITQSLIFKNREIRFTTQFGEDADELTYDGATFYRLKKR